VEEGRPRHGGSAARPSSSRATCIFYTMDMRHDKSTMGTLLGLGEKSGIGLPSGCRGWWLPEWKRSTSRKWYAGETVSVEMVRSVSVTAGVDGVYAAAGQWRHARDAHTAPRRVGVEGWSRSRGRAKCRLRSIRTSCRRSVRPVLVVNGVARAQCAE